MVQNTWGFRMCVEPEEKPQVPHYATPDFLSSLVALANFMRLSLLKAAHAAAG